MSNQYSFIHLRYGRRITATIFQKIRSYARARKRETEKTKRTRIARRGKAMAKKGTDENLEVHAPRERKSSPAYPCTRGRQRWMNRIFLAKKLRSHPCPSALVFQSFKQARASRSRSPSLRAPLSLLYRTTSPTGREKNVGPIEIDKSLVVSASVALPLELATIKIPGLIINLLGRRAPERLIRSFMHRVHKGPG